MWCWSLNSELWPCQEKRDCVVCSSPHAVAAILDRGWDRAYRCSEASLCCSCIHSSHPPLRSRSIRSYISQASMSAGLLIHCMIVKCLDTICRGKIGNKTLYFSSHSSWQVCGHGQVGDLGLCQQLPGVATPKTSGGGGFPEISYKQPSESIPSPLPPGIGCKTSPLH